MSLGKGMSQSKNIEKKEDESESSEATVQLQLRNGKLAFPYRAWAATRSASTTLSPRLLAVVGVGKERQRGHIGGAVNDSYGWVSGRRVKFRIWGCNANVRFVRLR